MPKKIRFEQVLKRYGYSYKDVAVLFDIYEISAQELTHGDTAIYFHELRTIARAFEIPLEALVPIRTQTTQKEPPAPE
jgi:hypothetical protein